MKNRRSNISDSVRKELEFDKVLSLLEGFAQSSANKERIRSLSIIRNSEKLNYNLDLLEEFKFIESDSNFPHFKYISLSNVITYLKIQNSVLSEDHIFDIYSATNWVNSLINFLGNNEYITPNIDQLIISLKKSVVIKKRIDKVFTPKRYIRSNASDSLVKIRDKISKKRVLVDKYFKDSKIHYMQLGYLADIKESFADGISLLAVSSEFKRKIKGRVRTQSKTKSISFIEPDKCISLNREISHLIEDEKEEIRKILRLLSDDLRGHFDRINLTLHLFEELDFLNAKLKLSKLMFANKPKVSDSRKIEIKDAFHPLLLIENNNKNIETIPQDIYFDDMHRVIVISGPNAGGKSIALKTFGLNQLMLQAGLFIPIHPNSSMSIFHHIFTDIGDNQSIENELSTYSYRLSRMKQILNDAGKSSFILIDEFGSGSDPSLGAELAGVFFKEIVNSGAYGVITTHYGNIKILADQTQFAENACMLFDEKDLNPLYKLKIGQPGSSYTFEVASNIGISKSIIDEARSGLKEGIVSFEDTIHRYQRLMSEFQLAQDELNIQKKEIELYKREYENKLNKLEDKLSNQRFIMEFESKYLNLGKRINKLIELYRNGSTMKSILPRLKKIIEKESNRKDEKVSDLKLIKKRKSRTKETFKIGQEVRIEGTNQQGEILELKSNTALLQIGFAKMEVKFEKLEKVQTS